MSEEIPQEVVELRTQVILEYMKLGPLIFASTYETFCKPGVTFTDEQSQAIRDVKEQGHG